MRLAFPPAIRATLLALVALVAATTVLSASSHAAAQQPPTAAAESPRQPPSSTLPAEPDDDYLSGTGSLGWELTASFGAVVVASVISYGVGHAAYSSCNREEDADLLGLRCATTGAGHIVLTYLITAPLFLTAAVVGSGRATGGTGSPSVTLGGALLGSLVGLGAAMAIAVAFNNDGDPHPATLVAAYTALVAGPTAGALIGYRASATPRQSHTTLSPTVHRDGAGLVLLGNF